MSRTRAFGFALLVVSPLAAIVATASRAASSGGSQATVPGWIPFFLTLLGGAVGAVLYWRCRPAPIETKINPSQVVGTTRTALARIVAVIEDLNSDSESIDLPELAVRMDVALNGDVTRLGERSADLHTALGEEAYGAFMTSFALGEDRLHRTRVAAAEGDLDATWDGMAEAEEHMAEALALLRDSAP